MAMISLLKLAALFVTIFGVLVIALGGGGGGRINDRKITPRPPPPRSHESPRSKQ